MSHGDFLGELWRITQANQKMHDIQANYYDASNLIMLEDGTESQIRIEKVVKDIAGGTSGECLVDIGCGTGNILKFSEKYFKRSLGIDVSLKMLLRNKGGKSGLVRGDINFLPFKSGLADGVSCFSVIHHLYQIDLLIREIYRVMKPGGYFYSDNDPNTFSTELFDLNKQSALFRIFMGIYFIPLRFSKSFRERNRLLDEFNRMLKERGVFEDFQKLSSEAECKLSDGINPYEVRRKLEETGFVDVKIYFHFRGKELRPGLDWPEVLSLLLRMLLKPKFKFDYGERSLGLRELAPYFAVLARKPG